MVVRDLFFFFFQAEDGIRDGTVTGVQTCALPIWRFSARPWDMRSTPSVCHGCAVGCNTQVQTRDDRVVRYMSRDNPAVDDGWLCRSEEHTSELQSQFHLVCRLLLEKKKKKKKKKT